MLADSWLNHGRNRHSCIHMENIIFSMYVVNTVEPGLMDTHVCIADTSILRTFFAIPSFEMMSPSPTLCIVDTVFSVSQACTQQAGPLYIKGNTFSSWGFTWCSYD